MFVFAILLFWLRLSVVRAGKNVLVQMKQFWGNIFAMPLSLTHFKKYNIGANESNLSIEST